MPDHSVLKQNNIQSKSLSVISWIIQSHTGHGFKVNKNIRAPKQAQVLTSRRQTWDSLVLLMHSYPTSHVRTSQNLDKRFIFCLTGGEEMIHLAHYCGSGSGDIRLESPCRSCWGPRCRPRLSRPVSAPCCQAAPPQWPRCCSTRSSDISWIEEIILMKAESFITWVRGASCRCRPSTSRSQWRAADPLCHILCSDNQSIIFIRQFPAPPTWSYTSCPRSRCRARPHPSARASPSHSRPLSRCWWNPCKTPFKI